MQSKNRLVYHSNGKLEKIETNPVFQGSVATTEFFLEMAEDLGDETWLPTDNVFICFTRADSQPSGPLWMSYIGKGVWKYTSNGWLEDVAVQGEADTFRVCFIMRRYSDVDNRRLVKTRTTEEAELQIYSAENYYPQDISTEVAEGLYEEVVKLENELDKFKDFAVGTVTARSVGYDKQPNATAEIITNSEGKYRLNMHFDIPQGEQGISVTSATLVEI